MIQKQLHHKENTTSLHPEKENPDKSRTIKSNYCNFQTNLNETASAQNIEELYKNANLTNFRKLNHPYTMRIALMKKNQKEQHYSKKKSSAKRTYQIKSAILVPNFAARWRSIRKYFGGQDDRESEARKSNSSKKTPHNYTQKKNPRQVQNNQIKIIIISRLNSISAKH
jgi:hypothetical protein